MIPSTDTKDQSNPYMDKSLMQNLSGFSPKANKEFITKHEVKSCENEQKNSGSEITFIFPSKLSLPPESLELCKTYNIDNMDLKIEQSLFSKYASEINSFTTWNDDTIIRFVTGYRHISNYNKRLKETQRVFQQYLSWRKDSDMDNALSIKEINNISITEYMCGSYIYGQDKYGHPLLWDEGLKMQKQSDLSIHKNCGEKGMDNVLAVIIKLLAEMKYATNKYYGLPTNVNNNNEFESKEEERIIGIFRHCIIFDLKKFNSKRVLKDRKIHEYYTKKGSLIAPEMIHKVYVINAPWIFQKIWKILKAFLHPNTIKKTQILGTEYMDELLKEIDINMIPPKFGGKGKWKVNVGSIPNDYPIQFQSEK